MADNEPPIQTYIVFDVETNGLFLGRVKITELTAVSVLLDHFDDNKPMQVPRVQNKLTLCLNPNFHIEPQVTKLTGLSNELLDDLPVFDVQACGMLNNFILRSPQPACLLAHNGNRFDFPILQSHLKSLSQQLCDSLLCADTLPAFRALKVVEMDPPWKIPHCVTTPFTPPADTAAKETSTEWPPEPPDFNINDVIKVMDEIEKSNESVIDRARQKAIQDSIYGRTPRKSLPILSNALPVSPRRFSALESCVPRKLDFESNSRPKRYNLDAVHRHLFNEPIQNAHKSESDVEGLLRCITAIGAPFHSWVQKNCRKFSSMPRMW